MGKGLIISIVIGIAITVGIVMYTNILDVTRPEIETSINYTKDAVSKVQGKDVVSKAEEISSDVKNVTSQIKVTNPFESSK